MSLSDKEKAYIKQLIDRNEPIPNKYRTCLFENPQDIELIWDGKNNEVTNVVLPFQPIEHIDEPRKEANSQMGLFSINAQTGRQAGGWSNKLIWGDNKLILSSLKNGSMRKEIENAGGIKLIYIDPPFDVGADFSYEIEVEGQDVTKQPSVIEEIAYRDTWGKGANSFLSMIYERLKIMKDLLAQDGSIYVHCDYRVNSALRLIIDEVFGKENFQNEICWCYSIGGKGNSRFARKHDSIYFYSKTDNYFFDGKHKDVSVPRKSNSHMRLKVDEAGREYQEKTDKASGKVYLYYVDEGKIPEDYWTDIEQLNREDAERLDYPTQKPEKLIRRIIAASTKEGDIVADFFCGSGTTLAVAEKLGRKWIGCDLGRFAIHTTRKRLINVQRELKKGNKPYRSFEILNLGKYERQYFLGINPNLSEEEKQIQTKQKEDEYLNLILQAYKAERVQQTPLFHGRKGSTMVVVGAVDSPVTHLLINKIVEKCQELRLSQVDVLGFEFEMGLVPYVIDEARQKGVALSLRYIPKDVFDKRAIDKGQVKFYDVAYIDFYPHINSNKMKVELKDFSSFYTQDDLNEVMENLKNKSNKIIIDSGNIVKITKDENGITSQEVLTKNWTDWIDYWAIDFDYESKKEIITILEDGEEKEIWTGNYIFENEWQSFRTKKDKTIELVSAEYQYKQKGKYKIAVKVIDIFGNDTTKVVEVNI
jgi:DNA modification methylase